MIRRPRTLRLRLALIGLAGILAPLLVLLLVSMVSNETQTTTSGDAESITERTRELSPWVPVTAAVLAIPAAALAWWWAGRAVAPLRAITAVAEDIQLTSLDRRIGPLAAPDEVADLAASFDRMLDRLDLATTAERRFVEDLSHQLRTPLAVLATSADVALAEPAPTVDDLRDAVRTTRRATAQLTGIVGDLLTAARADQDRRREHSADLLRIAHDVRDACATAARAREVDVVVHASTTCAIRFDGRSVQRALSCLVENAIRHTAHGSTVTIAVGTDAAAVDVGGSRHFVSVTDEGPGIDAEDRAHIFERYWSGDADRVGLGIGLAIVKQVADANDGLDVSSPITARGGSRFTMFFRADASPVTPRSSTTRPPGPD